MIINIIIKSICSLIGSIGFGVLFNIRGKRLIFAGIGGGLSWFFYLLFLHTFSMQTLAYFVASIAASIYSEILARVLKCPVTTFIICSIIPIVPGSGMYYTMFESIQGNVEKSLFTGVNTLFAAGAIAIGIILVSSTTRVFIFIKNNKNKMKKN